MGSEKEQLGKAFEEYSDELFRHCALRISDRERAVELTQETFLRTWNYMQTHEIQELKPFLYRTLRNLIIDEYRKHKTVSLEQMTQGEGESVETLLPKDEGNTLEAAMDRYDGSQALSLLQKLPDLYREVLLLRYVQGLSPKEIADLVGESENVVSVRIHRGIKKLKDLFDQHSHE